MAEQLTLGDDALDRQCFEMAVVRIRMRAEGENRQMTWAEVMAEAQLEFEKDVRAANARREEVKAEATALRRRRADR